MHVRNLSESVILLCRITHEERKLVVTIYHSGFIYFAEIPGRVGFCVKELANIKLIP